MFRSAKRPLNDKLCAHDAVGLGDAHAFEAARLPQSGHLLLKRCNDCFEIDLLVGQPHFFRDLQAFVLR